MSLSLICESGVGSVTGANFRFVRKEKGVEQNILIDCGLIQGSDQIELENRKPFAFDISTIDVLIITHAHLDHVGRIPKLIKEGYKGPIYSTPETRDLARLILDDAVTLLARSADRQKLEPMYSRDDVGASFANWHTIPYHQEKEIVPGISIYFKDAGHILGSAMVRVTADGVTTMFSGDLGNTPAPLLRDTESVEGSDFLIMESVYGDRNHEPQDLRDKHFARIVRETVERGGTAVIPAFSMERTQVLLYSLNNLVEQGLIPSVPVYIDSPLATRVTEVYRRGTELFNERVREQIRKGDDIFSFPRLTFVASHGESQSLDNKPGAKIIIAGSGMSTGGRVIQHEAAYAPDPNSTIVLVGYQTLGTLGRALAEGAKKISVGGQKIPVRARIETLYGFSAHKDSDNLVQYAATAANTLKQVFVAMGEPKASLFLAQRLRDEVGLNALYPEKGKEYILKP